MDFQFTQPQQELYDEYVALGRTLAPQLDVREVQGEFDRASWRSCAQRGLFGLPVPQDKGGQGADILSCMSAVQGLGYSCRDNGFLLAVNAHLWTVLLPVLKFGSPDQHRRYLPGLMDGTLRGAFALTEPDAGSDTSNLSTTAVSCSDGYLINGQKTIITSAPLADFFILMTATAPDKGRWGQTALIVDSKTEGVHISPPLGKMGLRTLPAANLEFKDCLVPGEALLGKEGAGSSLAAYCLDWDRCCILSSFLGTMQAQLEKTVEFARSREQFGQNVGSFQSVSNRIANMKVRLEAGRLLLYKAGWLKNEGKSTALDGAVAKLFLSEAFLESSLDAVRTMGGRGYLTEVGVERDLRDSVGGLLYAGTSDIQRNIISRLLGL